MHNVSFSSKKARAFVALAASLAAILALAGCVSAPAADPATTPSSGGAPAVTASPGLEPAGTSVAQAPAPAAQATPAAGSSSADAEIDALVAKAKASIDANRLAEAMRFYISALAKASSGGRRAKATELTSVIEAVGARLTLEPHESWLSPDGSQVVGDSRAASRGSGLMPAVYLYESYGYAKSPVPDAYIRFEFIQNEGTLTASVATDAKGLANSGVSAVTSPGKDAVIRAYPVFTDGSHSYAFKSVFRDFAFAAPPNLVLVAALERTPSGESANPRVLDAVASGLKPMGVDVAPFNGTLMPASFNAAFAGDAKALSALKGSLEPGYYALVYVEVGAPTRMEYAGKVYNIYISNAKATLRVVRADGTVVFAEAKDGVRGQGGTEQAAVDDCLVKVRDELGAMLKGKADAIKKAFES